MRSRLVSLAFLAMAFCVPGLAFAQRVTGEITGVVHDDSGAILPGVTVTVKGDDVAGSGATVTNARGFFRVPALSPGSYTVTYALSGFATVKSTKIRVSVGSESQADATLKVSQLSEEVTVTGEAPVVNATSNSVSTTYDKEWVRNAPMRRFTFFDLINAAPGISQSTSTSSRSTTLGSNSDENSYQLDGTDFTAPLTGSAWPWPNTDAIEEIQVLSLGAPAEYGNLQGAVFNVVTRQGSNQFHGDANFYFQDQGLTSNNTKDIKLSDGSFADVCPSDSTKRCPFNRDRYVDSTTQISGPIVKDKFWFFLSYQRQRDYDSQAGTDPLFPRRFEADRVFGKLNFNVNPKNRLQFAYHDDYYRIPAVATAVQAPSTISVESGHNPSPNLTWTSVLSDKTYVESRISGFYGQDHADPLEKGQPRVQPRFLDLDSGNVTGGIYLWYDGKIEKTAASVKVSHFADNFLGGSHDFKFGVQYNTGGHDYLYGYNDYIYTYSGVPGYGYTQVPYHSAGRMRNIGAFADDTFRVNSRLTINGGLRFDNADARFPAIDVVDRLGNKTGQTAARNGLYTWNNVSPRVGLTLKLDDAGKTVFKTHYGRYYSGIITGEFAPVGPAVTPRFLFSGTYDSAGNPEGSELVKDNTNLSVDPNFKAPYTDQFIVALERELTKDLAVSLNYTYKNSRRYGGWRDTGGVYAPVTVVDNEGAEATGNTFTLLQIQNDLSDRRFLLTNRDELFSKNHAGIFQINKRMSNHWQMVVSAVYLSSKGRNTSSKNAPTAEQNSHFGTFGQNPNDFLNTNGVLIASRPFTAKVQLVYELPKGFLVGANFVHQSGRPWGRQLRLPAATGIPGTLIFSEVLGDRRLPSQDGLDLRVQKQFTLSGETNVAIFADVLNALNKNSHENIGSRRADASTFGAPTRFVAPRRLMIGGKVRF